MNKINKFLALLLSIILSITLVGCFNNTTESSTTKSSETTQSSETTKSSVTTKSSETTSSSETTTSHVHSFDQKNSDSKYLANTATCIKKATYYYSCSCGEHNEETFEYGEFASHSYGDYVSNSDATCTADGTKTRTCSVCENKDTITDTGSKLDHTYNQEVESDTFLASNGNCATKKTYYYSCACGAKGSSTFEGSTYGEHSYKHVNATESSAVTKGLIEHYECDNCSKYFTLSEGVYTEVELSSLELSLTDFYTVKDLLTTSPTEEVKVKGIVITLVYDGTSANTTRHGFVIKDLVTNDTILVNGLDVIIPAYKDKNDVSIGIGSVVYATGTYKKDYNPSGSAYYTCLNVTAASKLEVIKTDTVKLAEFASSASSMNELGTLIGTETTKPKYGIYKIVGTPENPIAFASNSTKVSGNNLLFFLGKWSTLDNIKINGKQLALAPKSVTVSTGVAVDDLYKDVYGFSSNTPAKLDTTDPEVKYYIGTMYICLSEVTSSNYICSFVDYSSWDLQAYSEEIYNQSLIYKAYKDSVELKNLSSEIIAFDGGTGSCDLSTYASFETSDTAYFQIQNGVLVFIGSDENKQAAAKMAGIECKDSLDLNRLALVATAWGYYYQGGEIEYDQEINRRTINASPEEATALEGIYLDCSSFVNSVYYNTFGFNIYDKSVGYSRYIPTTANFNYYGNYYTNKGTGSSYGILYHKIVADITDTVSLRNEILSNLKIGDIINYRYNADTGGHVMIYIGNNTIIHCTGSSFKVGTTPRTSWDKANTNERNLGAIQLLTLDDVFTPNGTESSHRYIFNTSNAKTFTIFRPIENTAKYTSGLNATAQALARLSIQKVSIEKTSNIINYNTVTVGKDISYTIKLINKNTYNISNISVNEYIPNYCDFKTSGTNTSGYILNGQSIIWDNITLNAGETKTFTFTVTVNSDATVGSFINSNEGNVNGVKLNALYFQVRKAVNLINLESQLLSKVGASYSSVLELVSAVTSTTAFNSYTDQTLLDDIYPETSVFASTTSSMSDYLVTNLYGGLNTDDDNGTNPFEKDRCRYVLSSYLEAGDIIIVADGTTISSYVFVNSSTILGISNNKVVKYTSTAGTYMKYASYASSIPSFDLTSTQLFLEQLIAYDRFVVLRTTIVE